MLNGKPEQLVWQEAASAHTNAYLAVLNAYPTGNMLPMPRRK